MKIFCIGRNYAEHARELKNEIPEQPVIFMKPDTALLKGNQPFYYPDFSENVHFEVELVLKICKRGKYIQKKFAHKYYDKIGIGVDITARDVQQKCKEKGLPWEKAKGFDGSAPISNFIDKNELEPLDDIDFRLEKNGETVQQGNSQLMLFPFDQLIAEISRYFTLNMGDLVFTGTPKGVGPVQIGDRLSAYIGDRKMLDFSVK